MLLKQKVVLISREVIERARQRDEQTEVLTEVRTPFSALCQGDDTVFLLDCYTTSISAPDRTITNACFLKFRPVSLYDLKKYTKYEASVHYSPFSYL